MYQLIDSVWRLMNTVNKWLSVDWRLQLKWIIGEALRCGFHIDTAVDLSHLNRVLTRRDTTRFLRQVIHLSELKAND